MIPRRTLLLAASGPWLFSTTWAQGSDPQHAAWTALLRRHVRLQAGGRASQLHYAGIAAERPALKAYLDALSAVPAATFDAWPRAERLAFLINAYNAFTVELILTRYPKLVSIKDLGNLLQSPWKPRWIPLLGERVSLDDIEHGMIRAPGRYDDPRIHFAVNCASIGCPMLREEAYAADRLEAQLAEQERRFLSDRSRNRHDAASGQLMVSRIFDWYGSDFGALPAYFARHADLLADGAAERDAIRARRPRIRFLDYDWRLNDAA